MEVGVEAKRGKTPRPTPRAVVSMLGLVGKG